MGDSHVDYRKDRLERAILNKKVQNPGIKLMQCLEEIIAEDYRFSDELRDDAGLLLLKLKVRAREVGINNERAVARESLAVNEDSMSEQLSKETYVFGFTDYRDSFDPNAYKYPEQPKQTLRRKIYRMLPDRDLVVFWVTTALLVAAMLALIAVFGGSGGSGKITTFIPIKSGKSTILMPMRF